MVIPQQEHKQKGEHSPWWESSELQDPETECVVSSLLQPA